MNAQQTLNSIVLVPVADQLQQLNDELYTLGNTVEDLASRLQWCCKPALKEASSSINEPEAASEPSLLNSISLCRDKVVRIQSALNDLGDNLQV